MYLHFNQLAVSDITDNFANFFDTIITFLTAIYDYVVDLVKDMLQFTELFAVVIDVPNVLSSYIWAPIGTVCIILALAATIKVCLGWGNT